jgi:hypothetical protein
MTLSWWSRDALRAEARSGACRQRRKKWDVGLFEWSARRRHERCREQEDLGTSCWQL